MGGAPLNHQNRKYPCSQGLGLNEPCQHSLWKEARVPGEKLGFLVEPDYIFLHIDKYHASIVGLSDRRHIHSNIGKCYPGPEEK